MKYLIALALTATALAQDAPKPKFFTPTTIALFSAEALVRSLDAQSTTANLTNPCRCYKEDQISFVTNHGEAATYAYSLGVVAGVMGASYLAHRLHHDRIANLLPLIDIAFDSSAVAHNYAIAGRSAAPTNKPFLPSHGGFK